MSERARRLTDGGLLARNVVLNVLGQAAPLVVALVAIPLLVRGIGMERFGVLAIAWMLIGYFGLFDLGLGRSLTQVVSERLGTGREEEIPTVARTALVLTILLGGVGGAVLYLIAPWLTTDVLNVAPALEAETAAAFRVLALSLPLVTSTAALRGFLEALQRFGVVNALRVPLSTFSFLAPLLVLPFSRSLVVIVWVLVAGRVVAFLLHFLFCHRSDPGLAGGGGIRLREIAVLVRLGGWMTVSNVVSPLMVHFDRFVIGALLTMSAVTYYVTPYEVVTRLWILPAGIVGVMFPAFAASFTAGRERTAELLDRSVRVILLALFPAVLLIVALAPEGLALWMGPDFAERSAPVARWLALAIFVNSLAFVPLALLQGIGRPDLPAKVHLAELPLYLVLLFWLVGAHGITGAAIAWAARATADAAALFVLTARHVPETRGHLARIGGWAAAGLLVLGLGMVAWPLSGKLLFLGLSAAGFACVAWLVILPPEQRAWIRGAGVAS